MSVPDGLSVMYLQGYAPGLRRLDGPGGAEWVSQLTVAVIKHAITPATRFHTLRPWLLLPAFLIQHFKDPCWRLVMQLCSDLNAAPLYVYSFYCVGV